jgi:polyisoprenyl-teichoic acid--peptidoglycan teichoic acid transferase
MSQTQPSRPNRNRPNTPTAYPNTPSSRDQIPGYQIPPVSVYPQPSPTPSYRQVRPAPRRSMAGCACLVPVLLMCGMLSLFVAVYLLYPAQSDVLLLGMDYADPWNDLARTDTIILTTFNPWKPNVGMLSIPRDLWVNIPGVGENRINTAHFFAEVNNPGTGPSATMDTIEQNFGFRPDYLVRVRFETFKDIINAMGGVDINLDEPMAGYEAGRHHLTGSKALAFARSRAGSDDFFRMQQGQIILKAAFQQMSNPLKWHRIPAILLTLKRSINTTVPTWLWPRIAFALLRVGTDGIDNRTITREMVTPFITDQGASVLAPNWDLINPLVDEMFRQ